MMSIDHQELLQDFYEVARLSSFELKLGSVTCESGEAAHRATLPRGKMACYVFMSGDTCLKVGKVGPNSGPRFTYQHYDPKSSISNLAKSLLGSEATKRPFADSDLITEQNISHWIKGNTNRFNFYIDAAEPLALLSLLEAFLQARLRPIFEGRISK